MALLALSLLFSPDLLVSDITLAKAASFFACSVRGILLLRLLSSGRTFWCGVRSPAAPALWSAARRDIDGSTREVAPVFFFSAARSLNSRVLTFSWCPNL